VARSRRQRTLDEFRQVGGLLSLHAAYTDLDIGHRDHEYAGAVLRVLQEYVEVTAEVGGHHSGRHTVGLPSGKHLSYRLVMRALPSSPGSTDRPWPDRA
jgi:hypothetical protein